MHPSFINRFRVAALAVALTVIASPLLRAQIYTEAPDAGQTPGTAQATGISQPAPNGTSTIFGTFSSFTDADLFRINVSYAGGLGISTNNTLTHGNGGPGGLDTQLFLFDSLFRPIVMNDDASGLSLQSNIPAGNSFLLNLAPGVYYIGISLAGNNPVNSNNQLLFAGNGGNSTALRGMASGLNPNTLSTFDGNTSFNESGAYQINIFNVPETGSTLVLLGAAVGVMCVLRRRQAAVKVSSRS